MQGDVDRMDIKSIFSEKKRLFGEVLNNPENDNANHDYESHLNQGDAYISILDFLPFINIL